MSGSHESGRRSCGGGAPVGVVGCGGGGQGGSRWLWWVSGSPPRHTHSVYPHRNGGHPG